MMDSKPVVPLKGESNDSDDENTPLTTMNDPAYRPGNTKASLAKRRFCKVVLLPALVISAILIIVAIGFAIGLVTGATTIAKRSQNSYKWGDQVSTSGKSVKVVNWFDGVISAEKIKNNLM